MQSFSVKKTFKNQPNTLVVYWILIYGIRKHYLDITVKFHNY